MVCGWKVALVPGTFTPVVASNNKPISCTVIVGSGLDRQDNHENAEVA